MISIDMFQRSSLQCLQCHVGDGKSSALQAMHKLSNHCKTLLEQQVEEEGEAEGLSTPQKELR